MTAVQFEPGRKPTDERSSLESLARETDTAFSLVQAIYEEELQALAAHATVKTYVRLIAMRRTRLVLQALESKAALDEVH